MPIVNLNSSRVVKAMVLKVGLLQPSAGFGSSIKKDRPCVRLFRAGALSSSGSSLSRVTTAVWRATEKKHFSDWDDHLWSRE